MNIIKCNVGEISSYSHSYDGLVGYCSGITDFSGTLSELAIQAYANDSSDECKAACLSVLQSEAKAIKDALIYSDITVSNVVWQADEESIKNIYAKISSFDLSGSTDSVNWIMADNTVQSVSVDDLKAVAIAFDSRKQDIIDRYITWRSAEEITAFE